MPRGDRIAQQNDVATRNAAGTARPYAAGVASLIERRNLRPPPAFASLMLLHRFKGGRTDFWCERTSSLLWSCTPSI